MSELYQPVLREWRGSSLKDRVDLIWTQTYKSIRDPITRPMAIQMLREAGCPARDDKCDVEAIFWGVKNRFRYTPDIRDLDTFQTLRRSWLMGGGSPDGDLSKGGVWVGDCDDICIILISLGVSIGFRCAAKVISPNGREFVHIYAAMEVPRTPSRTEKKRWIWLDPTVVSAYPGWQPPSRFRRAERLFVYAEKQP